MKTIAGNLRPWALGTLLALAGVAVARLAAPEIADARSQVWITLAGRLLALAGIVTIALGIHRRATRAGQGDDARH